MLWSLLYLQRMAKVAFRLLLRPHKTQVALHNDPFHSPKPIAANYKHSQNQNVVSKKNCLIAWPPLSATGSEPAYRISVHCSLIQHCRKLTTKAIHVPVTFGPTNLFKRVIKVIPF